MPSVMLASSFGTWVSLTASPVRVHFNWLLVEYSCVRCADLASTWCWESWWALLMRAIKWT